MQCAADITAILHRVSAGDDDALDQLLPLVYEELRRHAAIHMAGERSDHTLQATALVHDAYVRLLGLHPKPSFSSQRHFYAAASRAMRRVLIDHARGKARLKRGGDRLRVDLTDVHDARTDQSISPQQLLELDEALQRLEASDDQVAELVRLRLYAGLSTTEAAKILGISRTVAYQHWDYAMSWFAVELGD